MTEKFTKIYLKFILAASFFVLACVSYVRHDFVTVKSIVLLLVSIGWIVLGVYKLRKPGLPDHRGQLNDDSSLI